MECSDISEQYCIRDNATIVKLVVRKDARQHETNCAAFGEFGAGGVEGTPRRKSGLRVNNRWLCGQN